jgi:hypothetical protein
MKTDNELIAEFMGVEKSSGGNWKLIPGHGPYLTAELMYDKSWDWLMPACKKWDELNYSNWSEKQIREYMKYCDDLDNTVSCYDIRPAYSQLVICIKWYNSIQK